MDIFEMLRRRNFYSTCESARVDVVPFTDLSAATSEPNLCHLHPQLAHGMSPHQSSRLVIRPATRERHGKYFGSDNPGHRKHINR